MLNLIGSIESFFKVLPPLSSFIFVIFRQASAIAVKSWAKEKHAHRVVVMYIREAQTRRHARERTNRVWFFKRWRGDPYPARNVANSQLCCRWLCRLFRLFCLFICQNKWATPYNSNSISLDECCSMTRLVERFNCTSSIKESAQINAGRVIVRVESSESVTIKRRPWKSTMFGPPNF